MAVERTIDLLSFQSEAAAALFPTSFEAGSFRITHFTCGTNKGSAEHADRGNGMRSTSAMMRIWYKKFSTSI